MKNSGAVQGLISLAILVVASVFILWGMNSIDLSDKNNSELSEFINADEFKELETNSENIEKAYTCLSNGDVVGYAVYVTRRGYNGDIRTCVVFDRDKRTVQSVRVLEQNETEQIGAKVAEKEFLEQFESKKVPFGTGNSLQDGTYRAENGDFDGGYKDFVEIVVQNGKITSVNWDSKAQNGGKSKKQASVDGEYVMTPDGLKWHEQAKLMEDRLISEQKVTSITYDDNGKTDAVTGVSISVDIFSQLASDCLEQAGGQDGVDIITGATISSTAVIESVELAGEFLKDGVK